MRRTVFATLALLFACRPAPPIEANLAIVGATVIDVATGETLPDRTVLVEDDRIVRVAGADDVEVPEGAEVVDATGSYLIPGLWDVHVHLTYDARFTEAMPGLFLRHGVTSIRDTGGLLEEMLPVVERMEAPGVRAPRVFFAGPLLDGERVVYDGENRPALGIANPDPETARANVARLAEAGVDFIKIYELVTPEVFHALVAAAEERGLPRDGHVPLSMLAREVAPHVQSLEHLRNLEMDCAANADELLAARRQILAEPAAEPGADLRARLHRLQRLPAVEAYDPDRCAETLAALTSTLQVPTLRLNALGLHSPFRRADFDAALEEIPQEVARVWGEAAREAREAPPARDTVFGSWSLFLVGEMHEAGVPVGAGTDTPIGYAIPGYSLHSELELLVEAGLSPREALRSATLRPAAFFGLDDRMGTVEVGRLADLVLLGADPLADISNTRTVEAVVSRGELLTREELEELVR